MRDGASGEEGSAVPLGHHRDEDVLDECFRVVSNLLSQATVFKNKPVPELDQHEVPERPVTYCFI